MLVTYYTRRPFAGQVSIEAQFEQIAEAMPRHIMSRKSICRFWSKGVLRRLYNALEAVWHQGDINHITGDVHYLALLLHKPRTVLTIHDCGTLQDRSWAARALLRWFWFRLPARRAAVVTAPSEKTRAELAEVLKVTPNRIRLVPNTVGDGFTPSPKRFAADCPEILQIGARPNKNVARLAEALRGIRCRLRIVGRLDAASEHALRECQIEFVNEIDLTAQEIIERYRACDLVSFVSTYEGFGVPIVEAQASGRPLITSNLSPMRELAGEGACLADPFDPADIRRGILRLISDAAYRETVVERGVRNADRYRPAGVAQQYSEIYEELLAAARGAGIKSQADSADRVLDKPAKQPAAPGFR